MNMRQLRALSVKQYDEATEDMQQTTFIKSLDGVRNIYEIDDYFIVTSKSTKNLFIAKESLDGWSIDA